ncbi:MAG: CBS domain-containing protein [Acidobacteria bacterium]|nr:CBS domain-containing protein [Acidobacteriota bacterium]
MKLEQIMTAKVITIGMDDTVEAAQTLFEQYHFHHLLVIGEENVLVGVVSDRDLLKTLSPFISTLVERPVDLRTLKKRIHQLMSYRPITASRDQTIREAAALMLGNEISCLPIVRTDRTVEGIVTWKDILKWLVERIGE